MNTYLSKARRYSKMQSTTGVRSHVPLIKAFYLLEDIQTPQMRVDCWDKRITEASMTITPHVYYITYIFPDRFWKYNKYLTLVVFIEFITLDIG